MVGGCPGGLMAALYTTRLGHETALIDRGGGRAAMMQDTHNAIGIPQSVSGNELLQTAREMLEGYGTELVRGYVTDLAVTPGADRRFRLEAEGPVDPASVPAISPTLREHRAVRATGD